MRLKTLRNQDQRTAEGILASLTLKLLPDPGIGSSRAISNVNAELLDKVMEEVRLKLKLEPTDYTPQALAKVYDYISTEMTEIAFAKKNVNKIKEKVGQQGDLRPDLYEIKFSKYFIDIFSRFSIRRSHIEDALRNPDYVEHILPEKVGLSNTSPASFYLKTIHNADNNSNSFSLIIITERHGYTQNVMMAWKLYHSEVDLFGASTPIQIFEKFLDKYGVNIKCGDEVCKFIYYKKKELISDLIKGQDNKIALEDLKDLIIPDLEVLNLKLHSQVDLKRVKDEDIFTNFVVRKIEKNCVEIALAFAVNMTKYVNDLRTHGDIIK